MQRNEDMWDSNEAPVPTTAMSFSDEFKIKALPVHKDQLLVLKDNDVLCGRGSIINKHVGNRRFRRIIAAKKDAYANCEKNSHKFFLAVSIVIAIERQEGRFVKRSDEKNEQSSLIQITRKEAVAKTAQALRDLLQRRSSRCRLSKYSSHQNCVETRIPRYSQQMQQGISANDSAEHYEASSYNDDTSRSSGSDANSDNGVSLFEPMNTDPLPTTRQCIVGFPEPLSVTNDMCHGTILIHNAGIQQALSSHPSWNSYPTGFGVQYPTLSYPPRTEFGSSRQGTSTSLGTCEELWVPQELEALMLSDPNVVHTLTTL